MERQVGEKSSCVQLRGEGEASSPIRGGVRGSAQVSDSCLSKFWGRRVMGALASYRGIEGKP